MRKVVYICSLSHSGSTALGLLIAGHSHMLGLGEIENTFNRAHEQNKTCTCGEEFDTCPFWGDVLPSIRQANSPSQIEVFYEEIRRRVSHMDTGRQELAVCDSSKTTNGIRYWMNLPDIDLRVILLVKDIRSFLVSHSRRAVSPAKKKKDGWKGVIVNRIPVLAFRWMRSNRRLHRFLLNKGIKHFQLGYEELCFRPESAVTAICEFLDMDFEQNMLDLTRSNSHILRGNKMRFDARNDAIRYDYRWMKDHPWINMNALPYLRFNGKMVYSNNFS